VTRKRAFPALLLLLAGCMPGVGAPPSLPPSGVTPSAPDFAAERAQLAEADRLLAGNRPGAARAVLAEVVSGLVMGRGGGDRERGDLLGRCLAREALLDVLIRLERAEGGGRAGWWREEDFLRPEVQAWKKRFLADGGRGLRRWMGQAGPYYGDIAAVIRIAGLPPELWVLTIVESGFRLRAVSRARAVGPWQFMAATGRHCGLLITSDRDERRDWVASTRAAARYLTELKEELGDGLLALAAFNCGPSRVRRELSEAPSRSFWDLSVPPETRTYVPRVLALIDILGNRHPDFRTEETTPLAYEEMEIPYTVEVEHLAKACGMSAKELLRMNPAWLLPITPADGRPVKARIPPGTRERLADRFQAKAIPRIKISPGRMYEIRRGDTLWDISRKFRVSLRTLLKVNGMTGKEVIHPGREIRVPG
jgi:membrane-bound lytic murein transglycosylase D